MNDEASPRPWRVESDNLTLRPPVCFILDANGAKVSGGFFSRADAALIVDAVNALDAVHAISIKLYNPLRKAEAERDRLRDIVRQALPFIEGAIDTVSTILGDAEMSKAASEFGAPPKDVLEAFVADGRRVLREARAAIGEDKE